MVQPGARSRIVLSIIWLLLGCAMIAVAVWLGWTRWSVPAQRPPALLLLTIALRPGRARRGAVVGRLADPRWPAGPRGRLDDPAPADARADAAAGPASGSSWPSPPSSGHAAGGGRRVRPAARRDPGRDGRAGARRAGADRRADHLVRDEPDPRGPGRQGDQADHRADLRPRRAGRRPGVRPRAAPAGRGRLLRGRAQGAARASPSSTPTTPSPCSACIRRSPTGRWAGTRSAA